MDVAAENILKDLKYVSARYNAAEITAQKCMNGTRVEIIQDIVEHLARPPDPLLRLVLCSGPAGSGKSTIAKTIAAHLEENGKLLAASFFFSRNYTERKDIVYLASTLAHQLADYNNVFRHLLITLLKEDHSRLIYADPKEQFQKMVVELLVQMPPSQTPWVICLDALDECGKDHGKILLHWLSEAISDIPAHIRFFLTGRPEVRYYCQADNHLSGLCKYSNMETVDPETARKDIRLYVAQSLINPAWGRGGWRVNEQDADEITSRADGLFIFAATAVRYVCTRADLAFHPQKSIDNLLKGNIHLNSLYDLYLQIIEEVIGIPVDKDVLERTEKVLGAIVNLLEPQNIKSLAGLLDMDVEELQQTLAHLSAVLSVPDNDNVGVVKIIHLSFHEFLTGRIREKQPQLLCGTEAQQHYLALNTFRVMQKELKFNILAFSPDGKQIVSGSNDGTICVWDAESGEMITGPIYSHTMPVNSVAFSPDGKQIISGSDDNTVCVWNAENRERVAGPFNGHTDGVRSVAFSPNGKQIVSGSADNTICVWNAENKEMVAGPFNGHTDWVYSVAFSPDGKQIVSGSADNTICVWDAESGEMITGLINGHTSTVTSVVFSPDGKQIASGSGDNTVCVWNTENREMVAGPFNGHTDWVYSVAFSPDGKQIVSGSSDHTVLVWDAKSGEVVSGPFKGHTESVYSVAFSPDGKWIVSGSSDHTVYSVAFSPDGKQIVSGSADNTAIVWDAESGEVVGGPFNGHTDVVSSVAFSPDGKWIASGSDDNTVLVWDAESGEVVAGPFEEHIKGVCSVAFSPDSNWIVSGSKDKTVCVWDVRSGEISAGPFNGHTDWVDSVAFSPDGQQIVSGSWDSTVLVWDVKSGEAVAGPFNGHTESVWSVAFSPDGKQIVSGSMDNTVHVWDAESGEMIGGPINSHTNWVCSVAFSPNGNWIVSGSADNTIGHTSIVRSVAFSPDGKQIASGSGDSTVQEPQYMLMVFIP
ncbi:WD-REPEATS-REGION domain-containing protein [Mycena sanguinolenta]|uniref:WD-REPEATS-REGION domain-containing protein n=1 Tax=Mycena sanguinolenta TaxID=230812 RepID=A0A8H6YX16_9AGAR|nr:WD-REPEATS-REGION domain-containing protein [Mycena sanguinolenta]